MNVAYIIPRLVYGGAARAILDSITVLRQRFNVTTTLISLGQAHDKLVGQAHAIGCNVVLSDAPDATQHTIAAADIVHVGFWNTPELYAWLASPLPPMRLVMTFHIGGEFAAQIITHPVLQFADWLVPTCHRTLALPVFQETLQARRERVSVIAETTTFAERTPRRTHQDVPHIGYIGTVDFIKMHPRFVEWCAAVQLPNAIFPVAGSGDGFKALARQADAFGITQQMQWLGYNSNVGALLTTFDVFGYPLCPETFATSDLIVQEAMWHGVPPVVLPYGGVPELLQHNETGLIVSEGDYPSAVRQLALDVPMRARLGENASIYAREHFGVDRTAPLKFDVYDKAMQCAKTDRVWQGEMLDPRFRGASALVASFGPGAAAYRASLTATDAAAVRAAEQQIACAPSIESGHGGILDYRNFYRDDAMLRMWAGLVLAQQKRYALAAAEFYAAQKLDLALPRVTDYLDRMISHQMIFDETE